MKLEKLDVEFKTHHFNLVDEIEEEHDLEEEETILKQHEDNVAALALKLQHLVTACGSFSPPSAEHKVALRRLQRLRKLLASTRDTLERPTAIKDTCLLHQHEEQLVEHKRELSEVRSSIFALDLDDGNEVNVLMDQIEESMFDCSLKLKKLLQKSSNSVPDGKGVKLPKLEVPTFDGNILHWKSFWEQFDVSIHSRSNLSNLCTYKMHSREARHRRLVTFG